MITDTVAEWHRLLETKNAAGLDDILADNVVFHSPVVHTPQAGKPITKLYLTAALFVFNNGHFKYLSEIISGNNAVLEFSTEIGGIYINGVDMITWGEDGRITEFKVMIRPLKAINMIHKMMGEMLMTLADNKTQASETK
ncbi:MAG: nuclear transport factor 2 family protein [Smithella sp.]